MFASTQLWQSQVRLGWYAAFVLCSLLFSAFFLDASDVTRRFSRIEDPQDETNLPHVDSRDDSKLGKDPAGTFLADLPTTQIKGTSWLRRIFPSPDIVVVFSDFEYVDFTLNLHESIKKNAPDHTQLIVVGMDQETVENCEKNGIVSLLYSDITATPWEAEGQLLLNDIKSRCVRLEVVRILQNQGYNIALLDSDVSLAKPFDILKYFSDLKTDVVTGHGTFPRTVYLEHGFALQSGFYYVRNTQVTRHFIEESVESCYVEENGQVAMNTVFHRDFEIVDSSEALDYGSRIHTAKSRDAGTGQERMRLAVLGKDMFPTGCTFVEDASPEAPVRHPECVKHRQKFSLAAKKNMKKDSLARQNAWFLPAPSKKALFWSFPGSGNTLLRYTYEKLTGKVGTTNSIYLDKRLQPVLPGEGRFDGTIVKVHPQTTKTSLSDSQIEEVFVKTPKRVVLMRNPYDAIWSWYQLLVTTSHTARVKHKDFRPAHFALQAKKWAQTFRSAVEEEFLPFAKEQPENFLLVLFDDLVKDQEITLKRIFDFVEEPVDDDMELQIQDHPLIHRARATDKDVTKEFAFTSIEGLVDEMWSILNGTASLYGFSKPVFGVEGPAEVLRHDQAQLPTPRHHRYLTYEPTGGLTNQLMELEIAIQMAQMSRRKLLLPPLLAEHVSLFPWFDNDPNALRGCRNPASSTAVHEANLTEIRTFLWSHVLDLDYIRSRVEVVLNLPMDFVAVLSELSLNEYHMCNTKWILEESEYDDYGCLPGYVSEVAPTQKKQIRLPTCLFQHSRLINIINMGVLFGSAHGGLPIPDVKFNNTAVAVAKFISDKIRSSSSSRKYDCAQIRLAGGVWEKNSPFVGRRDENFEKARTFVQEGDAQDALYIATDNEDLVRGHPDICTKRICFFSSDFQKDIKSTGIDHFLQINLLDYMVCSQADRVSTSRLSSFGSFIEALHILHESEENENSDMRVESEKFGMVTSKGETASGKYAYVLLLGSNPNEEEYSAYLLATRVLVASLRESGTRADIVVMMLEAHSTTKMLLEQDGAVVVDIDPLTTRLPSSHDFEDWFYKVALAKARAFELVQYERFQFIDADVVLAENTNFDFLFELSPESRMVSEGLGEESPIRSGWFMATPSLKDFAHLQRIADAQQFSVQSGWLNSDLPVHYPGWDHEGDSEAPWSFYGASLEQGLFYHKFYALPKSNNPKAKDQKLLNLLNDTTLHKLGIVHCYGSLKPWLAMDTGHSCFSREPFKTARRRWLDLASRIQPTTDTENPVLDYSSPMTNTGRLNFLRGLRFDPY